MQPIYAMTTFTPVAAIVAKMYGVSNNLVATCSTVFFITYVVLSMSVGWVCSKVGLGRTFQICTFICCGGVWLRYMTIMLTDDFAWIIAS